MVKDLWSALRPPSHVKTNYTLLQDKTKICFAGMASALPPEIG
jgi:hypothetical protein